MLMNLDRYQYGVEPIFIPDYIVSALQSRGVTLVELEGIIKEDVTRYMNGADNSGLLETYLKSKLSIMDIKDLLIYNTYTLLKLTTDPQGTYNYITNSLRNIAYDDKEKLNTLQALYNNMSNNDTNLYDFHLGADCIFVILHSGFSNYIINNTSSDVVEVFRKLVNKIVSSYGEARLVPSNFFKLYLNSLRKFSK